MRDISFWVVPIRDHAFFEQAVLQKGLGENLLQVASFTLQADDFTGRGLTRRIARQALLACLQEILRPVVIEALGDPFTSAKLGDRTLSAQTIQDNPDLLFSRKLAPCLALDFLMCLSADPSGPVLCLIALPFKDYDEPKHSFSKTPLSVSKAVTGNKIWMAWCE